MVHNTLRLIAVLVFLSIGTASARDRMAGSPNQAHAVNDSIKVFALSMSPEEYKKAYRSNRRVLRDLMWSSAQRAAGLIGIPTTSLSAIGLVAHLALRDSTTLPLTEDKSFDIEINDIHDDKRAILIRFRREW